MLYIRHLICYIIWQLDSLYISAILISLDEAGFSKPEYLYSTKSIS